MAVIHKLSPQLADMIAAGEVVERPASVIKELVENAVDAGAHKVTVEIKNGGITYMRVTDDGCGMAPEDAPTAFLRHATSKISSADDLNGIRTMGFRGEALAAISAVSRMEVLTCREGDAYGTAVTVEAGNVLEVQEAGCPQGTTMIVRDLFYNTPARMKFLKRDSVEGSYISGAVLRQALAHPEIAFRFIRDGKPELSTPGDGNLHSAIYAALGRSTAMEMVEVKSNWNGISISGYVGKPTANRGNRNYQHFFLNGRHVKNRMLSAALEEAYKNQMMVGRFPLCVLHINMPPELVDVNVHPAKTEVKFLRDGEVFDSIHYGVLGALNQTQDRPEMKPTQRTAPRQEFYQTMTAEQYRNKVASAPAAVKTEVKPAPAPAPVPKPAAQSVPVRPQTKPQYAPAAVVQSECAPKIAERPMEMRSNIQIPKMEPAPVVPEKKPVSVVKTPVEEPPVQEILPMPELPKEIVTEKEMPAETVKLPEIEPYRIIGQALDTYIIIEQGDGLLMIDKHAAHERILFEKLKQQKTEIMSQMLLSPIRAKLNREEMAVLLDKAEELEKLGFTVEDFGGGTLTVRAIPCDIREEDALGCLGEIAEVYMEGRKLDPETVHDELLHTIACKAAIKGGQKSDPMELKVLVREVLSREDIKYCPHGRPVCISLSRKTIERQFKRT